MPKKKGNLHSVGAGHPAPNLSVAPPSMKKGAKKPYPEQPQETPAQSSSKEKSSAPITIRINSNENTSKTSKAKTSNVKTKGTKAKAKKDPGAPRGIRSAYIFFTCSKKDDPAFSSLSLTERAKSLGAAWGAMSEDEKQPFVQQADQDKQRYAAEMASYEPPEADEEPVASGDDSPDTTIVCPKCSTLISLVQGKGGSATSGKSRAAGKKKKRDPSLPKKSKTAYQFFSNAYMKMEPYASMPMIERSKALGPVWRSLSSSDKAKFEKAAELDKERYNAEIKHHKPE